MDNIDLMKFLIESSDRDYISMIKNYETKQYTLEQIKNIEIMREYFKNIIEESKDNEEE